MARLLKNTRFLFVTLAVLALTLAGTAKPASANGALALALRGGPVTINQVYLQPQRDPTNAIITAQQMYNGSYWEFYDDGTFGFMPVGAGTLIAAELVPVYGQYQVQPDGSISFYGERSISLPTSQTTFRVAGQLWGDGNGGISARVQQEIVVVSAAYVNDTPFGSNSYKYIDLTMPMTQ